MRRRRVVFSTPSVLSADALGYRPGLHEGRKARAAAECVWERGFWPWIADTEP